MHIGNIIPLVSIITPTYNSAKFLEETIKSVLEQTYSNWEMLITDDCSTDNTINIIKKFQEKDNRITLYQLSVNSGAGPARNNSIKNANGKYITFLDSDDIWVPNKLEKQITYMQSKNAVFSHSSYGFINENGIKMRKPFIVSSYPVKYNDLLKCTEISCLTAIYDQEIIGKKFMPDLKRKQDYALWLSILKEGYSSIPQVEILAFYRQSKNSATNKKYKLIIKHYIFLRQQEKLNILNSIKFTIYWIWNGLVKYYI